MDPPRTHLTADFSHKGLTAKDLRQASASFHHSRVDLLKLGFNDIGDEGAEVVASFLKGYPHLKCLDLGFNNIGDKGMEALAESLSGKSSTSSSIQTLYLSGNLLSPLGMSYLSNAIASNTTLQRLYLTGNSAKAEGATYLAAALLQNHTIDLFCLNGNKIDVAGARALANSLFQNHSITHLNLSDNGIKDEGAAAIGHALSVHRNVRVLDLSFNSITYEGARALLFKVEHYPALKVLSLDNNKLGDRGAKFLAAALKQGLEVEELNIGFNEIEAEGLCGIINALSSRQPHETLRSLSLSGNLINNQVAKDAANMLIRNTTLQALFLDHSSISPVGEKYIAAGIATNRFTMLRRLKGFDLGKTLTLLGSPSHLEGLNNTATLEYLAMMWEEHKRHAVEAIRQQQLQQQQQQQLLLAQQQEQQQQQLPQQNLQQIQEQPLLLHAHNISLQNNTRMSYMPADVPRKPPQQEQRQEQQQQLLLQPQQQYQQQQKIQTESDISFQQEREESAIKRVEEEGERKNGASSEDILGAAGEIMSENPGSCSLSTSLSDPPTAPTTDSVVMVSGRIGPSVETERISGNVGGGSFDRNSSISSGVEHELAESGRMYEVLDHASMLRSEHLSNVDIQAAEGYVEREGRREEVEGGRGTEGEGEAFLRISEADKRAVKLSLAHKHREDLQSFPFLSKLDVNCNFISNNDKTKNNSNNTITTTNSSIINNNNSSGKVFFTSGSSPSSSSLSFSGVTAVAVASMSAAAQQDGFQQQPQHQPQKQQNQHPHHQQQQQQQQHMTVDEALAASGDQRSRSFKSSKVNLDLMDISGGYVHLESAEYLNKAGSAAADLPSGSPTTLLKKRSDHHQRHQEHQHQLQYLYQQQCNVAVVGDSVRSAAAVGGILPTARSTTATSIVSPRVGGVKSTVAAPTAGAAVGASMIMAAGVQDTTAQGVKNNNINNINISNFNSNSNTNANNSHTNKPSTPFLYTNSHTTIKNTRDGHNSSVGSSSEKSGSDTAVSERIGVFVVGQESLGCPPEEVDPGSSPVNVVDVLPSRAFMCPRSPGVVLIVNKARELASSPFSAAELWELHQLYYSPPSSFFHSSNGKGNGKGSGRGSVRGSVRGRDVNGESENTIGSSSQSATDESEEGEEALEDSSSRDGFRGRSFTHDPTTVIPHSNANNSEPNPQHNDYQQQQQATNSIAARDQRLIRAYMQGGVDPRRLQQQHAAQYSMVSRSNDANQNTSTNTIVATAASEGSNVRGGGGDGGGKRGDSGTNTATVYHYSSDSTEYATIEDASNTTVDAPTPSPSPSPSPSLPVSPRLDAAVNIVVQQQYKSQKQQHQQQQQQQQLKRSAAEQSNRSNCRSNPRPRKRAVNRSTLPRIAYYPRLKRCLEEYKSNGDEGRMLTLLRQLRYLEDSSGLEEEHVDLETLFVEEILNQ